MLVRLNRLNRGMAHFVPPIPVVRNFEDVDRDAPDDEQIDALLWVPTILVCRFLHQFPFIKNEGDELFSIGLMVVVDTVKNTKHPGHTIGAVVHTNCVAAMERYCNDLDSVVSVSTFTRYKNRNAGKDTPESVKLTHQAVVDDDCTELYVRDAAEFLGFDLNSATLAQKRQLARTLGLEE